MKLIVYKLSLNNIQKVKFHKNNEDDTFISTSQIHARNTVMMKKL